MKIVRFVFIGVLFLLLTCGVVLAAEADYYLHGWVISGGGGERDSEHYTVKDVIGQPAAGPSQSQNFLLEAGFLVPPQPPDVTPPAAVTDLAVSSVSANSVNLAWTAPGNDANVGTASLYDVRYSISMITEGNWDSATQCTGELSPQPAGSSESFVVTGLSPETIYYFALKTADEIPNWSGLSNVPSATTSSITVGSISGAVCEADGITPVSGAAISVYDYVQGTPVAEAVSSNGGYILAGLPAGDYKVRASCSGYVDEWYQEKTSSEEADRVRVKSGDDTINIDFSLSRLYEATPANPVVSDPYSGVTIEFNDLAETDVVSVSVNLCERNPSGTISGFKFLGKYYDIVTTPQYTGSVNLTIAYDDTGLTPKKEQKLKLFHLVGGVWDPIPDENLFRDILNNTITATVSSLSWFAIAQEEEVAPEGGCFIATAAYGSYLDEHVDVLRDFRDRYLLTNPIGSSLVSLYYKLSPPLADFIEEHPGLKPIVRAGLLPAVALSTLAVNAALAETMAIAGSLVLTSIILAVWGRKRQRGSQH